MINSPKTWLAYATLVLALLLNIEHSHAIKQIGLPSSICSGEFFSCDNITQKRWSLFETSKGLKFTADNYLTIGACSLNGQSNSDTYVLLALLNQIDDVYFDAKFSYHNDLSSYQNIPVSELEMIFPNIKYSRNIMSSSDSHAYIDYSHGAPFRYWIRHNRVENKLLMVAFFGYKDTFLCEFEPSHN